jgi:hypothetical protein
MTTLEYDYIGAAMAGETRHAAEVLKELGVAWEGFEGNPITDSVTFRGCTSVPDKLPDYVRTLP